VAYTPIISDQDVIDRFSDAEVLRQCFNGVPDVSLVNSANYPALLRAREDATADVARNTGNNFYFWRQAGAYPLEVVQLACYRAILYCWLYGTHGKAAPRNVVDMAEFALRELEKIGSGQAPFGGDPELQPRKPGRINNDPCLRRSTYGAWRLSGWLGRRR